MIWCNDNNIQQKIIFISLESYYLCFLYIYAHIYIYVYILSVKIWASNKFQTFSLIALPWLRKLVIHLFGEFLDDLKCCFSSGETMGIWGKQNATVMHQWLKVFTVSQNPWILFGLVWTWICLYVSRWSDKMSLWNWNSYQVGFSCMLMGDLTARVECMTAPFSCKDPSAYIEKKTNLGEKVSCVKCEHGQECSQNNRTVTKVAEGMVSFLLSPLG